MSHDFSERPLIAGAFVGIRSWRVSTTGVLTGVHMREPWTAGESEAECKAFASTFAHQMAYIGAQMGVATAEMAWTMGSIGAQMYGRVYLVKRPKKKPPPEQVTPPTHPVAKLDCTCGFYAYFDLKTNPHHGPGNVLGLVEGYGTMTIGARGFRASKARIVALIEPVPPEVRDRYGVPIFSTVAAALAEFPLSEPPAPPREPVDVAFREALQRRRERNTGPAARVGLDGRRRYRGQA